MLQVMRSIVFDQRAAAALTFGAAKQQFFIVFRIIWVYALAHLGKQHMHKQSAVLLYCLHKKSEPVQNLATCPF
jgi:hypothetical protein